jgi:hypothetical protein
MSSTWREDTFGWLRGFVPAFVRYWATLVLFWPTVLKMRLEAWLFGRKRVWDRVPDSPLVLGQVPMLRGDVAALHALGVRSVVNHEVADGSHRGGRTHEGVEGRHGLGQLRGANLLADEVARASTRATEEEQLGVGGHGVGLHVGKGGHEARADATHAHADAQACRGLRGQAGDATHATQGRAQRQHGGQRG